MSQFIKHIGKLSDNSKVLVMFRFLPDAPDQALVVKTQDLKPEIHDELMQIVENQGQSDMDFYKVASRTSFINGGQVLESLHTSGKLVKLPVADITMTPLPNVTIPLSDLNAQLKQMIPEKTTSSDIGTEETPPLTQRSAPGTLDDKTIAEGMRRQALQFEFEAKKLREEADALDPSRPGRPRNKGADAKAAAVEA
jgi:hypothetical protein